MITGADSGIGGEPTACFARDGSDLFLVAHAAGYRALMRGRRMVAPGFSAHFADGPLLVVSAPALVVAPAFMPDGYDWVAHSTIKSAAQGLAGAWIARLGVATFGLAVLLLAAVASPNSARRRGAATGSRSRMRIGGAGCSFG